MRVFGEISRLRQRIARTVTALAPAVAAAVLVLPAPAGAFLIQPTGGPSSVTNGIVLGPDGNFWIAEEFSDEVVRMSQAGAVLDRYSVGVQPTGLATGPGGRVWVAVTGHGVPGTAHLVWFDATAPVPTQHPVVIPQVAGIEPCGPEAIVAGTDGRMYFSIPADYFVAPFQTPCNGGGVLGSVASDTVSGPGTLGPSVNAFDLEVSGGKLFVPDYDNGVVHRFALGSAVPEATVTTSAVTSNPYGVAADRAGNIWFTESGSGKVGRFPASAPDGAAATVFTPSGGTLTDPAGIVAGADGNIYVAANGSANVGRVSADGSLFAFYSVANSKPVEIINGTDGDFWFTDRSQTRILRLVNTAPRVTTGTATATASTTASAMAAVNPRGNETQVVFDFGPTTAYGSNSVPVTVANGTDVVEATGVLTRLTPSTTYHIRARATNAEGSATGADTTFRTPSGDADGDGVAVPADCNDANPAIHPGAVDKPGDKIDQDCSGADATFPELSAFAGFVYDYRPRYTVVSKIDITRLRGGETAKIRCTGRRCPFAVKTFTKLKKGKRSFGRKLMRGRKLPVGVTLSVRVTKRGTIGTSAVLRVRKKKRPQITRACLQPGAKKASACG
jgi:streptogramin lyase